MEIAIIADVHLANHAMFGGKVQQGVNVRAGLVLSSLATLVRQLNKRKVGNLIIAGDLFDKWRVEPQLLDGLREVFHQADFDIGVMAGNHDQRTEEEYDNAIAGLGREYLSVPTGITRYVSFGDFDKLISIQHYGVFDDNTPDFLKTGKARHWREILEVARNNGGNTSLTFCGDYHTPAEYYGKDGAVIVPGAFVPTGFDNPGVDYGYCWIVDLNTMSLDNFQVPGPRFQVCTSQDEIRQFANECYSMKCTAFVRIKGEFDPKFVEELNSRYSKPIVLGVDHIPMVKPSKQKAKRAKSSVEQRIEEYFEKNEINAEVRKIVRENL